MPEPLTPAEIARMREHVETHALHVATPQEHPEWDAARIVATMQGLHSALADATRRAEATEYWQQWVYPEGASAEQIRAELQDFRTLMDHTTQIYSWATKGQITKPLTLPEEVIRIAEDAWNEEAIWMRDETVKDLTEERDAAEERIGELEAQAGAQRAAAVALTEAASELYMSESHDGHCYTVTRSTMDRLLDAVQGLRAALAPGGNGQCE